MNLISMTTALSADLAKAPDFTVNVAPNSLLLVLFPLTSSLLNTPAGGVRCLAAPKHQIHNRSLLHSEKISSKNGNADCGDAAEAKSPARPLTVQKIAVFSREVFLAALKSCWRTASVISH